MSLVLPILVFFLLQLPHEQNDSMPLWSNGQDSCTDPYFYSNKITHFIFSVRCAYQENTKPLDEEKAPFTCRIILTKLQVKI